MDARTAESLWRLCMDDGGGILHRRVHPGLCQHPGLPLCGTLTFGRVMVSTLQTDSKKQAEVDRLASLKADQKHSRQFCQSSLSCTWSPKCSGMGDFKRSKHRCSQPAGSPDHVNGGGVPNRTPLGRITAERERSCAWRNLLNVCSGRGFDSRRVHQPFPSSGYCLRRWQRLPPL